MKSITDLYALIHALNILDNYQKIQLWRSKRTLPPELPVPLLKILLINMFDIILLHWSDTVSNFLGSLIKWIKRLCFRKSYTWSVQAAFPACWLWLNEGNWVAPIQSKIFTCNTISYISYDNSTYQSEYNAHVF